MNNDFNENKNNAVNEEAVEAEAVNDAAAANEEAAVNEEAAEAPAKKNFGKKLVGLIVAFAVIVVGAITAIAITNSPAFVADRALDRLVDDFLAREEVEYFSSLFTEGSVDVSVKGEIDEVELDASAKTYFNLKDNQVMVDNIDVKFEALDETRKITGDFFVSDKTVYVANDEILDGTYGITRGSLEKELEDSIFNPESDSEYALDEEIYEILRSACKIADSELPEELEADVTELLTRYSKEIKKSIAKHAEFEKRNEEVKLNDGKKNVRVVYIIITPDTIANVIEDLYDYIEQDDELRDLVVKYYEEIAEILEATDYIDEDFDIEDAYDEAIESLGDMVETAVDTVKDLDDDMFLALCIATPKNSTKALRVWTIAGEDIDDMYDEDEVTEIFYLDFGSKGLKKTGEIEAGVIGVDEKLKYTVDTEEKGVTQYKLQFGSSIKVTFKFDEKDDKFKFSFTQEGLLGQDASFALEGKYTTKGDKATLELKKIKIDGEELEEFDMDISVTFDTKDKMPEPESKFDSVFDLTEDDIKDIMERAEEWAGVEEAPEN